VEKDTIKDEGNATFKFKLTNTGNGPDTFDITLDGVRSGWKADTPAQYDLGPAQSVTGVLTIDVPESKADKGVYKIMVISTSKGEGVTDNETFTLEVEKTPTSPIGEIIGINNDGSGGFNMLYIIIPLLALIIIVAIVIIALVARRRGKKTKPTPVKPQIHSKAPEYSAPSTTVEKGKVEMTPVYAVSPPAAQKSPPAKSAPPPPPEPAPGPEASAAAEPVAPAPEMAAPPEILPEHAPEPDISMDPEPDLGLEWEE
jgi:hypothetical protein